METWHIRSRPAIAGGAANERCVDSVGMAGRGYGDAGPPDVCDGKVASRGG